MALFGRMLAAYAKDAAPAAPIPARDMCAVTFDELVADHDRRRRRRAR